MTKLFALLNNTLQPSLALSKLEKTILLLKAQLLFVKKSTTYVPIHEVEELLSVLTQPSTQQALPLLIEYCKLLFARSPTDAHRIQKKLKKILRQKSSEALPFIFHLNKYTELAELLCTRETDRKDTLVPQQSVYVNDSELINPYDIQVQGLTQRRLAYRVFHMPTLDEVRARFSTHGKKSTAMSIMRFWRRQTPSISMELLQTLFENIRHIKTTLAIYELLTSSRDKKATLIKLLNAAYQAYELAYDSEQEGTMALLLHAIPNDILEQACLFMSHEDITHCINSIHARPTRPHQKQLQALFDKTCRLIDDFCQEQPLALETVIMLLTDFPTHLCTDMPPLLASYISTRSSKEQNGFTGFYRKLDKINKKASAFQKRDPFTLTLQQQINIMMLFEIFGDVANQLLSEQLAGTLLSLERFLSQLPPLPTAVVKAFAEHVMKMKDSFGVEHCQEILEAMTITAALLNTDAKLTPMVCEAVSQYHQSITSPQEVSMPRQLFMKLLPKLRQQSSDSLKAILTNPKLFKLYTINDVARLFSAIQNVSDDDYEEAFYLLMISKLKGIPFETLLKETDSDIARGILRHNAQIAAKIRAHGASPDTVLHYNRPKHYIYIASNQITTIKQRNRHAKLYDVLMPLSENILSLKDEVRDNFSPKQQSQLKAIVKGCQFLKGFRRSHINPDDACFEPIYGSHLKKIMANIRALAQADCEHLSHLAKTFERATKVFQTLKASITTERKTKKIKSSFGFRVEMWDKSHPMTYQLGDKVSCCLATNGAQSRAMTQRQFDDAWLIFTVTDCKTQQPVGLVWAFLAETSNNKLKLVINFFEANNHYSHDKALRGVIRNILIDYCHQYTAESLGQNDFYIAFLAYGPFTLDFHYPFADVIFKDKLGGALSPAHHYTTSTTTKEETSKHYYIASLEPNDDEEDEEDDEMFYKFTSEQLESDRINGQYSLEELIIQEMQPAIRKKLPFEKFLSEFITDFRRELSILFDSDINKIISEILPYKARYTAKQISISDTRASGESDFFRPRHTPNNPQGSVEAKSSSSLSNQAVV